MTNETNQNRTPAGVPTGGQFAASTKGESGVALGDRADFFPPAPLTAHDVEVLTEYKGTFEDGYDGAKVNRVFMRLESAHLMCVWDRHDDYGYGGQSEFFGTALEGYEPSKGHFSTRPVGSYRSLHPDVHEYLFDPDSDIDPERIPSLLANEVTEAGDPNRDMSDLPGDGFRNVAVKTITGAAHGYEDDEEVCAADDCDDDLTDNEGYDGYCGYHAELIEAHEAGEHETHIESDSGSVDDCPECG